MPLRHPRTTYFHQAGNPLKKSIEAGSRRHTQRLSRFGLSHRKPLDQIRQCRRSADRKRGEHRSRRERFRVLVDQFLKQSELLNEWFTTLDLDRNALNDSCCCQSSNSSQQPVLVRRCRAREISKLPCYRQRLSISSGSKDKTIQSIFHSSKLATQGFLNRVKLAPKRHRLLVRCQALHPD